MTRRPRLTNQLLVSAALLFAVSAQTGVAKAWTPLGPLCASSLAPEVPENLNICEYIIQSVIVPPSFSDVLSCIDCPSLDLRCLNPICDLPFPLCLGDLICTHTIPFLDVSGYIWYYDDVSCSVSLETGEHLLQKFAYDQVSNFETLQLGGHNSVAYGLVSDYLDTVECLHGHALSNGLKTLMIQMRDASGFDEDETFSNADLDELRFISEDDFAYLADTAHGMTLGHLVILRDDEHPTFDIVRNWSHNLADVQAGLLCPEERKALEVILHEAVHVRQYRNVGKQTFVDVYLPDVLLNGGDQNSTHFENEAFEFSGQLDGDNPTYEFIDGEISSELLAFLATRGSEPPGCAAVVPSPSGPVATTPGTGGVPTVTIVSACGASRCAPRPIECTGNHQAAVTFVGTATDPDGIANTEWFTRDSAGNKSVLANGTTPTITFASAFGSNSGRYRVNFSAEDNASNVGLTSTTISVVDWEPPVITVVPAAATYECNVATYVEAGASASDICDPATPSVSVGGDTVDTSQPDSYVVEYSASDDVLNVGTATRTVTVVDTLRPTIDAPPEIVTQDRTPNLGLAVATDVCDVAPTILNDAPAIFPFGTTIVTWWSRDAAGNESLRDTQTVTVLGGDASSAGRDFSCDLSRDGEVFCWGADDAGQLGDGANVDRWGPRSIDMTSLARQVSVGARHACAVKADGSVQCWGSGQDGRLGNGSTLDRNVPFSVSSLTGAVQVSAGGQVQLLVDDGHSCAVLNSGAVKCWGENGQGQLGDTTSVDRSTPVTTQLPSGTSAMQVTAGGAHSCAVDSIGRAFCWGAGANGRLGNGTTNDRTLPVQVSFPVGVQAVQIDAGERHTCAVDGLGSVWCWGSGANGRLGNNSLQDKPAPVKITLPASAVQVSAGVAHTCALLTTGRVFCWGSPFSGRLGDGSVIFDQLVPLQSAGITNAVQVSAGNDHSCARLFDGSALRDVCWGDNSRGELGDGTSVARATQVQISTLCDQTGFFPPSAGAAASCIIGRGAANPPTAMCWGSNGFGQLGEGTGASRRAPTPVVGTSNSPLAAAGGFHGCALTATGGVQCWGNNLFGQLGDGTLIPRQTAVPISGGGSYAFVATGANHSCGIVGGQVKCWGANTNGQIGDGTILPRRVPTLVTGLPGQALYLDLGDRHSCAVVQNGTNRQVWCWGGNLHGQLGNGFLLDSWVPVRAGTIADAWMVSAGANHTCATTTSGPVFCWGQSLLGQVGNSVVFFDAWSPQQVVNTSNAPLSAPFAFVSAGGSHSCVAPVGPMQQAACWGNNLLGQLGNGNILPNPRAQTVAGLAFVSSVSAGDNYTCARVSSTSTACWGDNSSGQLGDGTLVNRPTPVRAVGACY